MRRRLLLSAALAAAVTACDQQSTSPTNSAAAFDLPADQVINGVEHKLTQDGIRRAVLHSDTAYAYEDARQLDLVGVHVVFYDDAGVEAGTLTSKRGDYDLSSALFIARDSVVLITEGPQGERRLLSDELNFDVRSDALWSDKPFTLEENGRLSRGTTFRSDSKFETWTVTGGQATGRVDGAEGGLSF